MPTDRLDWSVVSADEPTILATSGGLAPSRRLRWEVGPLTDYAVQLSGVSARAPKAEHWVSSDGASSVTEQRLPTRLL